ncbi:NAD-dependent epimerase/dehydratase family protein [Acidovorax sp. RAC01]|uniref:NAD-dependent epimerase/dehydratase family protein n=1 Tax=Acidovorax sp. RAC01 TaxID=1842533 RepID=UPI00083E84E2|nr:NAD-dependent epimerase/dehydratase family protein [Acidovorax sp. RAC01]AOG23419.1 3-beta hydroxysteroid dehydrogenase/isomerase family protein [Acidovorax sp. RAC01]
MRVFLTGSAGFIGKTVTQALEQAGHTVVAGVSPRHGAGGNRVPVDFARDTTTAAWLPRLQGIDAVVNTVGVLRDTRARPIDAVHQHTPIALFDACVQAGVRRVVHVSALGIVGSSTRYARTKLAADEHLLGLRTQGAAISPAVLRPSVVFGKGGDSSALFMNLARLPLALFPGPMLTARVQPVSVHDLAAAITALLGPHLATEGVIECTGPEALPMGAFIASLRQQLGSSPATVFRLPDPLTQLSARMGDLVPSVPWCTETLTMLGSDNVGDPAAFEQLLGRKGVHYSQLVATAWR